MEASWGCYVVVMSSHRIGSRGESASGMDGFMKRRRVIEGVKANCKNKLRKTKRRTRRA
jgi:hypothetical protein